MTSDHHTPSGRSVTVAFRPISENRLDLGQIKPPEFGSIPEVIGPNNRGSLSRAHRQFPISRAGFPALRLHYNTGPVHHLARLDCQARTDVPYWAFSGGPERAPGIAWPATMPPRAAPSKQRPSRAASDIWQALRSPWERKYQLPRVPWSGLRGAPFKHAPPQPDRTVSPLWPVAASARPLRWPLACIIHEEVSKPRFFAMEAA